MLEGKIGVRYARKRRRRAKLREWMASVLASANSWFHGLLLSKKTPLGFLIREDPLIFNVKWLAQSGLITPEFAPHGSFSLFSSSVLGINPSSRRRLWRRNVLTSVIWKRNLGWRENVIRFSNLFILSRLSLSLSFPLTLIKLQSIFLSLYKLEVTRVAYLLWLNPSGDANCINH